MQKVRTPGFDVILTEMLNLSVVESVRLLKTIADGIWRTEMVLSDWMNELLIGTHKKGSHTTCDNYCGIALLSILNQLNTYAEVILCGTGVASVREGLCVSVVFSTGSDGESKGVPQANLHLLH